MFGAHASPYLQPGGWQLGLSHRSLVSDKHYNGTERQIEREEQGTYVINRQNLTDLTITYGVTRALSVSAGLPFVNASWSIPLPIQPVLGPRSEQNASGFGDVSLTARYWLLDTGQSDHNIALGLGFKAPTGNSRIVDEYPDLTGQSPALKAVDQSIQPGDGGWGILLDVAAFRRLGRATVFGSFSYLANPRNTNDTPSIIEGLGLGSNPAFADLLVNSVPDQYVGRLGVTVPVSDSGIAASLAARVEGLPRYDLFGRSDGWRRPGREIFLEPGVAISRGNLTAVFNVPIGIHRNRFPNPYTGRPGDATFPDYILLGGLSYRFGGSSPEVVSGEIPRRAIGAPASHLTLRPADTFPRLTLHDLKGDPQALEQILAPGRRTLVNLWATWCLPCREEMPFLQRQAAALSAAGIDIVGVSLDEDAAPVAPFLRDMGIDYPVYVAARLEEIEALYADGPIAIPASILLDEDGRVLQVFDGWSEATEAAFEALAR